MIDMEYRKETIDMINALGLTANDLVEMTGYTKQHIEKFLAFGKVPSKTECRIWFKVKRLYREVK